MVISSGEINAEVASLYFHVPFCKRKCDYCHFYAIPDKKPFLEQFMEGLKLEWDCWVSDLQANRICSIYFGGGTPALLGPKNIETLLSRIQRANISLSRDIEITLEANPEDTTPGLIKSYASLGINRVSIGVQSLDDRLLQSISRRHTAQKAREAVLATKDGGISNISIDLMYDLPGQTLTMWEKTLHDVLDLPITHLSLYNLVIEPHTVFYKKRDALQSLLPDSDTSLRLYEKAIEKLQNVEWKQYEISAFQKQGHYSRHNTGYWTARPFLGFGPSAFSYWGGKRFRNVANLNRYTKALRQGRSPVDFEEELPEAAKRRELLAINLRLLEGVDRIEFERKHGSLDRQTKTTIESLTQQGLLKKSGKRLALTNRGVHLYDTIAAEII
ncbi:MAG: radical SAM family heme chaperone HemW [Waddliaceae bacterium]